MRPDGLSHSVRAWASSFHSVLRVRMAGLQLLLPRFA